MMIVVCGTSPVNTLVLIDGVDLLPQRFTTVVLPAGVLAELQHPRTPPRVASWARQLPPWVRVIPPICRSAIDHAIRSRPFRARRAVRTPQQGTTAAQSLWRRWAVSIITRAGIFGLSRARRFIRHGVAVQNQCVRRASWSYRGNGPTGSKAWHLNRIARVPHRVVGGKRLRSACRSSRRRITAGSHASRAGGRGSSGSDLTRCSPGRVG